MPYADLDQLIADYLPEATKDSEIAAVGRILDNVSAFIDTYCRRPSGFFSPNDTETEKRVRGEGMNYLRVPLHQIGTISQVKRRDYILDSENYYESEKNGWLYLEEDYFYPETSGFDFCFQTCTWYQDAIYKVTAKFGYAATPLPIVEAARLMTTNIWETVKGTLGQVSVEGFVLKPNLIPPDVLEMLEEFRRREFEV